MARNTAPAAPERLLRWRDLTDLVGLTKRGIEEMVRRGEFPRPLRVGRRVVAWKVSDVAAWQNGLPRATGGIPATFHNRRAALGLTPDKVA